MRRLCRHWIAVATVVLATACSRMLPPQPDPSRFFVLTAMDPPTADPSPTSDRVRPLTLAVGPVRLAPYLDRNDLAIRLSADEIRYSDGERWAEPLERNVTNVLALNLSPDTATSPRFLEEIAGLPGKRVVVEVTEHARVDDYDALNRSLAQLRARGVRVDIFRLGTGPLRLGPTAFGLHAHRCHPPRMHGLLLVSEHKRLPSSGPRGIQ